MYLVKALDTAPGAVRPNEVVLWTAGQIKSVADSEILYYQSHPTVFTVLSGPVVEDQVDVRGKIAAAYIDFNTTGEAGMTITIDGVVYTEADTAVPASGVFTNGASAAASATSLIAAINGDTRAAVPFTAVADISGDGVWLFWDAIGADGNVTITTDSASNCTVQNSTGGADLAFHDSVFISHTVNTQELLSGGVEIPIPFTPTGFMIEAFSATGAPIFFTDLVTIEATPDRIKITTDGATNLANTNVIQLVAFN